MNVSVNLGTTKIIETFVLSSTIGSICNFHNNSVIQSKPKLFEVYFTHSLNLNWVLK
jgi:hypothetical protein